MLDEIGALPEDPEDLRAFTARLLAEVKAQAILIEKLRHQLAGHRAHRFGTSAETADQLQLALETSEIAAAAMTAKLRLPDIEPRDKPKRRPIPAYIPRTEIELTPSEDRCADCGGTLRRIGADERDFLTGSYARHTKTKPLKDVDIFFCLGEKERHWRDKAPDEVLKAFEACLAKKYGADCVERGRRCVTVEFEKRNPTADEEGKVLSNDAVPAFELGSCYEIPDRDLGRWIKTDPDIHKEKSTAKNRECGGKWVPLVKMLKRWNRSAGKPIAPSFLIEVMALELVDPPFTTYASEVRRFFAAALDGLNRDWPDPAGYGPPVSDQMTADQESGSRLRSSALLRPRRPLPYVLRRRAKTAKRWRSGARSWASIFLRVSHGPDDCSAPSGRRFPGKAVLAPGDIAARSRQPRAQGHLREGAEGVRRHCR